MSAPFKAIVVGGGPVGLLTALTLRAANIDYLLLEQYDTIVTKAGADLVVSPMVMRVLSQLGLLDDFLRISFELSRIRRIDHEKNDIGTLSFFESIKDNHGAAPRVLKRYDILKLFYEELTRDGTDKILINKAVSSIEPVAEGVKVHFADGHTYAANIVIGADGAHSTVRSEMRNLALQAGSENYNEENPFLTTFVGLWIRFPRAHLPVGLSDETHGYGAGSQLFTGEETALSGIYITLEKPTRERLRSSTQDQEALVAKWGHMPICNDGSVTIAKAWETRISSGLVYLEEGVLKHWSWGGKVVLVGDSAHKFTPTNGSGCNYGMIDVVMLVNKLRGALQASAPNHPSQKQLDELFQVYQKGREKAVAVECLASNNATATATWQNDKMRHADLNIITTKKAQDFLMDLTAKYTSKTPALDFLPADTRVIGRVPWQDTRVTAQL